MSDLSVCSAYNYPAEIQAIPSKSDPRNILLSNYKEFLMERVVITTDGKEIRGRLTTLIQDATRKAVKDRCQGESISQAVVRCVLEKLQYSFRQTTLAGLPTGPAYERRIPTGMSPRDFGNEKVNYPMSQYSDLSYLPVGGLGTPLCEIDYSTCYIREGQMVQDKPIRQMKLKINQQEYDLNKAKAVYSALYPFSERSYNLPIQFSILQYSPVIPGNYNVSSLPVEVMEINAQNPTDKPVQVTFTITQENILGWYPKKGKEIKGDPSGRLVWNQQSKENNREKVEAGDVRGVLFTKNGNQEDLVRTGSGITGSIAIVSLAINGKVKVEPQLAGGKNSAGLKITFTLQPGEEITHPIIAAFDNPYHVFQYDATRADSPAVRMSKFYTRSYGTTGQGAVKIAQDGLENYEDWKQQINDFHAVILQDKNLPDFFKQALINELYVLTETGIWEAGQGRFAYLESIDYKMYNTSDVNSYTWALLMLYPELEKKDLLEFAKLVPLSDPKPRWWGTDRWAHLAPPEWRHLYWAPIKDEGMVCHDLGGLLGQGVFPFENSCNEFDWSNPNMWIDLAPKFVLRLWRYVDFMERQTGQIDKEFIQKVYPAAVQAIMTLEKRWGDPQTHVPSSKGIPDWTYDTISGHGFTPNVVTQWVAALEAMQKLEQIIYGSENILYRDWSEKGKAVLQQLWNEQGYYNAFVTPDSSQTNFNIHSDMLFGDFYARISGLGGVVPDQQAAQALETIYQVNGARWSAVGGRGPLGLVNLRGFSGEQNKTEQGDEGWTGAMLLNAAHQILLGRTTDNPKLVQNGWDIVQGFFNVVYSQSPDSQHWFGRTPEGYVNPDDAHYDKPGTKYREGKILPDKSKAPATGRAPKYMRALAIWAIYAAIKGNDSPFGIYTQKIENQPDRFNQPFGK